METSGEGVTYQDVNILVFIGRQLIENLRLHLKIISAE